MAIAGCIGVDTEYGKAITTHMSMPLRFGVLRSVAEITIDSLDALDELDDLIDRVDAAFGKRNDIAHNQWLRDPETGEFGMVKETSRISYKVEVIPATVDRVKADALEIYHSGTSLMSFLMRHGLLPSLLSEPRPRAHKTKAARRERRKNLR